MPATRRPSVLQVMQPETGGVPAQVLRLSMGLRERGWAVEVATTRRSMVRSSLVEAGIPVHEISFARPRDYLASAARLRALDRRQGFAIVHAHSSKAGALVRSTLANRRRLIYSPHCFAFNAGSVLPLRLFYQGVEQLLVARSGAIVAVCEWERTDASRRLRGVRTRLRTIENGVTPCAPTEIDAELAEFRGTLPLAGFIGRLERQKDPLTVVRAAGLLRRRGALHGRLAIVGNGSLRESVEAEIERLGVGDSVLQLPFRPPVSRYLRGFDAFVLSSRWEALPVSALEAMSCGLPVIATRVGGVPDFVQEGRTGRLLAPGDPAGLADALADAFADPDRWGAMGATGRKVAAERFGFERMVDQTANLYRRVLTDGAR
jgi:glycosyltransferase involved in cell wall biosynthesis